MGRRNDPDYEYYKINSPGIDYVDSCSCSSHGGLAVCALGLAAQAAFPLALAALLPLVNPE